MNPGVFTAVAVAVIVLAAFVALFNLTASLILIACVLFSAIGVLIFRLVGLRSMR